MKPGELPSMSGNTPTLVEAPKNPALAFSGVTTEATPSPVVQSLNIKTTQPEHKPAVYQAPRNQREGAKLVIAELPNELPAMASSLPAVAKAPLNPSLAFSNTVHESGPSPLVIPEHPVQVAPSKHLPCVTVDTESLSPVVTNPSFVYAPRNPESGRRRIKVKLKRKKRIVR